MSAPHIKEIINYMRKLQKKILSDNYFNDYETASRNNSSCTMLRQEDGHTLNVKTTVATSFCYIQIPMKNLKAGKGYKLICEIKNASGTDTAMLSLYDRTKQATIVKIETNNAEYIKLEKEFILDSTNDLDNLQILLYASQSTASIQSKFYKNIMVVDVEANTNVYRAYMNLPEQVAEHEERLNVLDTHRVIKDFRVSTICT